MANNLTRFDPLDVGRFDPFRGFEDFFREFQPRALREIEPPPRMRLDVRETEQAYSVSADLPGMRKEDIKVDVDGKRVTISAQTSRVWEGKVGESTLCSERYVGQQRRSFELENEIDDAAVVAKYADGVLELALPKRAGGAGKKKVVVT